MTAVTIARVRGIPIRIHISFLLILAWAALSTPDGESVAQNVAFVAALFACVVLHELGHALTASYFGIGTRDIVLYPFGGIASLLQEPRPKAEFFVTIAGPLVNVVLALCILPFVRLTMHDLTAGTASFFAQLGAANIAIALFNMLPAFPMDGGRIVRSLLALSGVKNATSIALQLGKFVSLLLGIFAVATGQVILLIIAGFVFFAAAQELIQEQARQEAQRHVVKEVMTPVEGLQTFTHGTTLSQALPTIVRTPQPLFPVLHGEELVGVVPRETALERACTGTEDCYLSELTIRQVSPLSPDEPVQKVSELIRGDGESPLVVFENGLFRGLVLKDTVLDFLLISNFRRRMRRQEDEV